MRIPQGLRSALASQTGGGGGGSSPPTTDEYFGDVSLLLYGDGSNGSTAIVDSSSNNHAITVYGDSQISTAQSKFGGSSLYFDGTGDYIEVPSSTDLSFGSGDFTIECWVYFNSLQSNMTVASFPGGGNYPTIVFGHLTTLNVYATSTGGSWSILAGNSLGTPSVGVWHHIALVRSGNTFHGFFDGSLSFSVNSSNTLYGTSSQVRIGAFNNTGTLGEMDGYVDDFRVTKGVARYTSSFTPPTASFSTVTPGEKYFYQNSLLLSADGSNGSTAIVDSSANAHTITVNGNAQISTTQSKFGGSSMYFDGNGDYLTAPVDSSFEFGTGDFTVELWANISSLTAGNYQRAAFVALGYGGVGGSVNTTYNGWGLTYTPGTLLFGRYDGTSYAYSASVTLSSNTWYHIAVTRSGTSLRLFVNGTQVGSTHTTSVSFNKVDNNGLHLGYYRSGSGGASHDWYHGYMDDVRITKGVARYTSDFTIPTSEASSSDPYFSSTLFLLNGNGTNGSTHIVNTIGNEKNYVNPTAQDAVNGEIQNGATPYWVDVVPANADLNYQGNAFSRVHSSNASQTVYWVGSQYSNGNVTQARFDLRDFPTVTSVRIYGEQPYIGTNYHPYSARLLDSNKNVISNTTLVINNSNPQWLTVPVAGSPAFLEIYAPTNPGARLHLGGIEVNGQHLVNSPITQVGSPVISTAQSKFGGSSLYFDGSSRIQIPNTTALGTNDFTIEFWAYPTDLTGARCWATSADPTYDKQGFWIGTSGTSLYWLVGSGGSSWQVLRIVGTVNLNQWNHIALSRSGNTFRAFIDGVVVDTVTNSVSLTNANNNISVGGRTAGATQYSQGYIDDFRLTLGVARYGNFTPPTAGLSTLTPVEPYFHNNSLLLHGDGTNGSTTFKDDSINNHTITANGNVQISTAQSKFGGSSMYFDGAGDWLQIAQNTSTDLASSDFTIEAWIRPASVSGVNTIFGQWNLSGSGPMLWLNGANLKLGIYRNGNGSFLTGSTTLSVDTWYHIAVVRSGSTITLFVNGQSDGSYNYTLSLYTYDTNVGSWRGYSPGRDFEGYIDDFRITKGVARYTSNFTPPTSALPSL